MALMASTESHRCRSAASGWSRSDFPVFFLNSLRARLKPASSIDLKSEDGVDVWPRVEKDMVIATVGWLVMIALVEWQEYVGADGETRGAVWFASCIPHLDGWPAGEPEPALGR